MGTKKNSKGFFQAQKFAQSVSALIDSLPSETDKQEVVSQLETLIRFLSDIKSHVEAVPSQQGSAAVRVAIDKLASLFEQAKSNPAIGAALGIRAALPRSKETAITPDELERARAQLARFESLPIDELRNVLSEMNARDLKALASAMGIRATQRTAHDALTHQVATKISNTRGYRSLRDGAE